MERTLEHKAFRLDVKDLGDDGTFTGYLSVFGNEDSYGDVVDRGAFTKTLADQGGSFVMLWQHDDTQPIGTMTGVQDERGLFVKAQLNMEVERAREAYALLKQGAIKGLSIGYSAIKWAMNGTTRHLQEIKLYEGSVVTFPANTLATVASVKALRDDMAEMRSLLSEMQDVLGAKAWDGSASRYTDAEWAKACILDRGEGSAKERYGLPIATPGNSYTNPDKGGVAAAASRIGQAKGPAAAIRTAYKRLLAAYHKLDMAPPQSVMDGAKSSDSETEAVRAVLDEFKALADGRAAATAGEPDDSTREAIKALIAEVRTAA